MLDAHTVCCTMENTYFKVTQDENKQASLPLHTDVTTLPGSQSASSSRGRTRADTNGRPAHPVSIAPPNPLHIGKLYGISRWGMRKPTQTFELSHRTSVFFFEWALQ